MRDDVFEECRYRSPSEPQDICGLLRAVSDGVEEALKYLGRARDDLRDVENADEVLALLEDLECVVDDIPPVLKDIERANDSLGECLTYWKDAAETLRDTEDDWADCLERFEDRAPRVPDNTCPMIDSVLSDLKSASRRIARLQSGLSDLDGAEDGMSNVDAIEQELGGLDRVMEDIRKANEALRGCGRHWHVGSRDIAAAEELAPAL